jgi:hypothetical protein
MTFRVLEPLNAKSPSMNIAKSAREKGLTKPWPEPPEICDYCDADLVQVGGRLVCRGCNRTYDLNPSTDTPKD